MIFDAILTIDIVLARCRQREKFFFYALLPQVWVQKGKL